RGGTEHLGVPAVGRGRALVPRLCTGPRLQVGEGCQGVVGNRGGTMGPPGTAPVVMAHPPVSVLAAALLGLADLLGQTRVATGEGPGVTAAGTEVTRLFRCRPPGAGELVIIAIIGPRPIATGTPP